VSGQAHLLLGDLLKCGDVPRAEAAAVSEGGWCVLVLALPARPGEDTPALSLLERNCLAVLAQAQEPLSAERVRLALKKMPGGGIYSLATVKRALARLRELGLVENNARSPRGYYLPDRLPLLARASA
jgi:hypothetical protein